MMCVWGELHVYMYMHCLYEMTIFIRAMMNLLSARMEFWSLHGFTRLMWTM